MRIGILSESYEPVKNGVTTSVRTLVDELRAEHHHVCILAPHYPDYEDESPFVLRVPSILTAMNPDYPVPFPWFPRLRREIRKLQLDVLHSQSPWFLGLLAARAAARFRIPHVSTYHTMYDRYAHYVSFLPAPTTQSLLEWWLPEYYNQTDRVIVPSEVAKRSLQSYGVETEITIIPTGVPIPDRDALSEESCRAVRARFDIPQNAPLLLYVGRIAREKNVELVLDAFCAIADEFPTARLLIVGDGQHGQTCRRVAARTSGANRIIFAGEIPRLDLDPIYAAADLFVFGSTTETQGLVVAESRAAGTPCVVVDEGGASESVTHGEDGLILPAKWQDFAEALRTLLSNPARLNAMREACRRNAHFYTPTAMARRVLEVYQSVLPTECADDRPVVAAQR